MTKKFRKSIYSWEWQTLIDWLVKQRKQASLSQRQLAENIGVMHSLVGKVEKGERRLDPIELVLYCQGMRANPGELIKIIQRNSIVQPLPLKPEQGAGQRPPKVCR